jgi:MFS family permease
MVQGIGEAPLWALAPALLSRQYPAQKGRVIGLYHAAIHVGLLSGSLLGLLLLPRWHGTEAFFLFIMVSALGGVMVLWCVDDPVHISRAHTRPGHIASLLRLITRREIVSVLGAITVYGAGYGVFLTIVPAFLFTVNDVSQAGVGSAFLIFYLMISVAQLITGPLSDRIGSMWPMVCALLVVAVGMGSLVVVPFPWLNLVLGLISGGLGILAVSSLASVNERVSPALKGTLSGVCYVCWGVGYFLCPMIVGALGQHSQYAVGFCGFAGLCGFEAIVVLWGNIRSSSTSLVVSHHHR